MRTTIDAAGRIVIPKAIRLRVGLHSGAEVEVREREGRIEIEQALVTMTLRDEGSGRVAVPEEELPALTDEIVRDTLERTRR